MPTAFWIADGQNYIEEAAASALSLAAHMPDVGRILFTPSQNYSSDAFTEVRNLPARRSEFWFVDAVQYMGLAVNGIRDEQLLYLDTDTYICGDLSDLFETLDKFDIVGAHAPGRRTAGGADWVPAAFPEINVGVNGIKRTPQMLWLMDEWLERMGRNPQNNDQPALRALLWENAGIIRLGVLPPEYNARFGFGLFVRYAVKVLHGRPQDGDYKRVEQRVNASTDLRAWRRGELG